jgi:hypothetical protein
MDRSTPHEYARERMVSIFPEVDGVAAAASRMEQRYQSYRARLTAYFRGQASSHDVLVERVAYIEAASRYVDARVKAGLVHGGVPVVAGGGNDDRPD